MRRPLVYYLAAAALGLVLWALLFVLAGAAMGQTATDVGTGYTSSNPTGEVSADLLQAREQGTLDRANRIRLRPNDTALSTSATCADAGTAARLTLLDTDESATDNWQWCEGTSLFADIVQTGSDIIADTEVLVGSGAGTGAYVPLSGDVTLANTGAVTISANKITSGMVAFNYAGSASEGGPATTALALDANPADCSATQFATTIAASGNLTCAQVAFTDVSGAATDAQVPNTITVDLATAATALAANPADCSAGQYATTIAASGALTCAAVPFSDLSGSATAAQMPSGTNTTTWTTDADNTAGTEPATGAGLKIEGGSGDVAALYDATGNDLEFTGATGGYTFDAVITGNLTGAVTGNASTATALASNPSDCSANQFATTIAASGNLTCAQPAFTDLSGSATDAQVPDTITASNYLLLAGGTVTGSLDVSGQLEAPNSTATIAGECDASGEAGRLYVDSDAAAGSKLKVCGGVGGWENVDTATSGITGLTADSGGTTTGATVTLAGGTNGVDTVRSSDTVTLNLDTTEVGTTTWGAGSGYTWTFDGGTGTDATLAVGASGSMVWTGVHDFGGAALEVPNSTTAMTTCTPGQIKLDTDGLPGARLLACIATDAPIGVDSAFGSEIDATEFAPTLTFTSSNMLDLYTNSAAIRFPVTTTSPSSEGAWVIDDATDEPEWYAGGTLQNLSNYARLTGRSAGQTILGKATSDGSDDGTLVLGASGAASAARGPYISLTGNQGTFGGGVFMSGGSDGGAQSGIYLAVAGGAASVMPDGDFAIGYGILSEATCTHNLCLPGTAAKTIGMERHATANTAGNSLTIDAGGATSGATDKAGGTLFLAPGVSTGTGKGKVALQASRAGSTGTTTNSITTTFWIDPGTRTGSDVAVPHLEAEDATAPTMGTCGTSPALSTGSNDTSGEVVIGSGTPGTTCTMNFAATWSNAPFCTVSWSSDPSTLTRTWVTTTTTTMVLNTNTGNLTASAKFMYLCIGRQ